MSTTYTALVERGSKFWIITIEGTGWATQARHLGEVEEMATDLISIMSDQEPGTFTLTVQRQLPDTVATHLSKAHLLRQQAAQAQTEATTELRYAAQALAGTGMNLRDIGTALGISYQRAHQLLKNPA